jgi:hypothetical protein
MILLVSFVSSVVSVVVTTIASAFGPTLALTGNDSQTILYGFAILLTPLSFSLSICLPLSFCICRCPSVSLSLSLTLFSHPRDAKHARICLCSRWSVSGLNGRLSCHLQVPPLPSLFSSSPFNHFYLSFATFRLGPAIMTTVSCIVGTVLLLSISPSSNFFFPHSIFFSSLYRRERFEYFTKCSTERKEISRADLGVISRLTD